jgi:hypothetical protein
MKYIYLYTTATYQLKNWYKIGETTTDPIKRIQSQDNASNPEPLTLIAYWQVRDKISDKQVHLELETIGFEKLRGNREWFELSDAPQQDIECALSLLNKKFECLPVKESIVDSEQFTIKNYDEIWWGNNSPPPSLSC